MSDVLDPKDSLDPRMVNDYATLAKKQIRARMKAVRGGFSAGALQKRSAAIVSRLKALPAIVDAKGIALFWPMVDRGEVDLRQLDAWLRKRGVPVYYPFMDEKPAGGYVTGFRLTSCVGDLSKSRMGFLQPREGSLARAGDVSLVLVPGLAVDVQGRRIGYGAGYYDATLSDVAPPARSLIVAYQFQVLAELPQEPHDRSCDGVLTDEECYPEELDQALAF